MLRGSSPDSSPEPERSSSDSVSMCEVVDVDRARGEVVRVRVSEVVVVSAGKEVVVVGSLHVGPV